MSNLSHLLLILDVREFEFYIVLKSFHFIIEKNKRRNGTKLKQCQTHC